MPSPPRYLAYPAGSTAEPLRGGGIKQSYFAKRGTSTSPSSEPHPAARISVDLLAALLVGLHAVWLLVHFVPTFVGPDAGGLYVQARLIAEGLGTGLVAESPAQFIGNHWMEMPDGAFASRFPPGFPLVLAALYSVGGPTLALLLTPLLASVSVLLVYLITKSFTSPWMALGAASIMATLSPVNRFALHNDSTTVTMTILLVGILLLSRWDAHPTRRGAFWAGLVLGIIPTLRYAEVVLGIPVGVFLLLRAFERPEVRRHVVWAVLGAAAPIVILLVHNSVAYGAPWLTGYSLSGESGAFTLSKLIEQAPQYGRVMFSMNGPGVLNVIGLAGMLWMLFKKRWRAWGAFSATAVLAVTLLFGSYYWAVNVDAPLAMRFFVPILPLFLLSAIWTLDRLPSSRLRAPLTLLVIGSQIVVGSIRSSENALDEWMQLSHANAVVVAVERAVPEGSILIGPRASLEVLDYYGEWRLVADWLFPGAAERDGTLLTWDMDSAVAEGLEGLPGPIQIDKFARSRRHYVGLDERELAAAVWKDVRSWAPRADVYWLGSGNDVRRMTSFLPLLDVREVADVNMRNAGTMMPYWVPTGPLSLYRITEEREARLGQPLSREKPPIRVGPAS
jgi:dolichyl-phosphate-mannose-protein mannosyltransferase